MIAGITAVFAPPVNMNLQQFSKVEATPLKSWLEVRDFYHAGKIHVHLKGAAHINTVELENMTQHF